MVTSEVNANNDFLGYYTREDEDEFYPLPTAKTYEALVPKDEDFDHLNRYSGSCLPLRPQVQPNTKPTPAQPVAE